MPHCQVCEHALNTTRADQKVQDENRINSVAGKSRKKTLSSLLAIERQSVKQGLNQAATPGGSALRPNRPALGER
jgi:hypothetical protein